MKTHSVAAHTSCRRSLRTAVAPAPLCRAIRTATHPTGAVRLPATTKYRPITSPSRTARMGCSTSVRAELAPRCSGPVPAIRISRVSERITARGAAAIEMPAHNHPQDLDAMRAALTTQRALSTSVIPTIRRAHCSRRPKSKVLSTLLVPTRLSYWMKPMLTTSIPLRPDSISLVARYPQLVGAHCSRRLTAPESVKESMILN